MNLIFRCAYCNSNLMPMNYPISNYDHIEFKINPCLICEDRKFHEGREVGREEGYQKAKDDFGLLF